jgi:AraC family transcriptional regulator of adaptative response/methylated-DNA-[protein]-cysteine methyltransferase
VSLIEAIEENPLRRWRDQDLRARGLTPERVRRWFKREFGMTFHAYSRSRRLGEAIGQIRDGDQVAGAAFDAGFESLSGFNEALRQATGLTPREAASTRSVHLARIPSLLGPLVAGATDSALCLLEFADRRMLPTQIRRVHERFRCVFVPGENPVLQTLKTQMGEYFSGARREFEIPLDAPGTPFQEAVWKQLREVPYGTTVSYGELARRLGQPRAVRAVARANGDNRLAIVIPCHRVIGKDGKLTGYGGGLWRKQRLLDLETGVRSLDLEYVELAEDH